MATPYSPYGIGLSILAIPPYLLSKIVGHTDFLVSMVNPLLMAWAVLMVYKVGRALRWSAAHALTAAIGFGLFTQALQATTELFSEPGVTLCVVVVVFGAVRWRGGDRMAPLWIGLAAAAAVQLRSDSLFTVWIGLLAVPLFVPWRAIFERRAILMAGVPMASSALLLVWYDELRYHKVLASYGGSFSTPLGFGLHGLLLDPGKSIFVFDSLTLLGVAGLGALLGRDRPLAALYLLLIVPRTIFFAKWSSWGGGWAWGPRFLLPCVPLLVLAAVELLRMWDRSSLPGMLTRAAAAVLVIGSAVVNYLSVRVPYQQWLQVLATPTTLAKFGLPRQTAAQRISGYNAHVTTGPLWGDVLLIRHHLAEMGSGLVGPRPCRRGHRARRGFGGVPHGRLRSWSGAGRPAMLVRPKRARRKRSPTWATWARLTRSCRRKCPTSVRARGDELARLPPIEAAADTMFLSLGIGPLPGPASVDDLAAALVVLVDADGPTGFARIDELAGGAHLEQLSVHPDHGRRGTGRALLRAACDWAAGNGYAELTLATYRDVPWNGAVLRVGRLRRGRPGRPVVRRARPPARGACDGPLRRPGAHGAPRVSSA